MIKSICRIASVLGISLVIPFTAGESLCYGQDKSAGGRYVYRSPFRWFIISNEVVDLQDDERKVEVLLEGKAFSEVNLKKLYYLVVERFPKPDTFSVYVYTSMEQAPTPEESFPMSGLPVSEEYDKYPSAVFIRSEGNELIRYKYKPPYKTTPWKTVILKGRDPYDTGK